MNVLFYTNKLSSQPNGDYIDNIHKKWWGNYELLEDHHGFIQWLFPNSFQSRFNRLALPLGKLEIEEFRTNAEIARRYQTTYMMMLEFYGLKLKCKRSGEVTHCRHSLHRERSTTNPHKLFWQDRFHQTLLTSFHNHMRVTRILSSLVLCGFGRYAKQLSLFLGSEIKNGGLSDLKKCGVYEREWK